MPVVQVFENTFLGITTSTWTIMILAIFCVMLAFAVFFLVNKLGPCEGYLWAVLFGKGSDHNLGIIFQNHSITIKKLNYFSGVFDRLGMTWQAKKSEHHRFGACSAELVADYWGLTMDPKVNTATLQFINAWNSDQDYSLYEGEDFSWLPEKSTRKPITDFDSLYEAIERCPADSEIRIKAFCYVPMYDLQRYYPKNLSASDLTGYLEAMKKVDEDNRSSPAASYLPIICLGVGVLMGAGIVFLMG